jgi:nucleotide-binding universal stress UspA family protein
MTFKIVHLHLLTHPAPTPPGVIAFAGDLCRQFGARLEVSISHPLVRTPSHWLAGRMLQTLAQSLEAATREAAAAHESEVQAVAARAKIVATSRRVTYSFPTADDTHAWLGRTADLCIVGLQKDDPNRNPMLEDWLFQSGRGTILCPPDIDACPLNKVVIAWDLSRAASRAVADAMPLLEKAKQVRVLTARGEKDFPQEDVGAPLLDYLAAHGVSADAETIELGGVPISTAILSYAERIGADLIVMGAFGHSRAQEFLLGGATKGIIAESTTPVFMSH